MERHKVKSDPPTTVQEAKQARFLEQVRVTVAAVRHEINNPLAIISGNAQLLLEMARAENLDVEWTKPLHDIEEASRRLVVLINELGTLKEVLAQIYLEEEDGLFSPPEGD